MHYLADTINRDNFADVYKIGRTLGSGATSIVHEVELQDYDPARHKVKNYAAKVIKLGRKMSMAKMVCYEIEILKTIRQGNLVRAVDCFVDNSSDIFSIVIVMDLVNGYPITQVSSMLVLPDSFIGALGNQIARGLNYLHSINIAHRDLKGENIIFSVAEKTVKLSNL